MRRALAVVLVLGGCAHHAAAEGTAAPPPPSENDAAAEAALWSQAQADDQAGRAAQAREGYASLLLRYPLDPHADEARRRMADLDLQLKRYRDAEQALKALANRAPDSEKAKTAEQLAEAAAGAGDFAEAVRAYVQVERLDPDPAAKAHAGEEVQRIIDTRLPALAIAQLLADLPADDPAVPALAAKKALVLAHEGNPEAAAAAADFLARFPQSPYAARVQALQKRLAAAAQVKPGLVGIILPKSPAQFAAYGTAALQGLQLALGDDPSRVVVEDSQGDPAAAAAAVEKHAEAGVQVIVGPILSTEAAAASAAAQRLGIPIVTLARAEGLTGMGPYVFRNFLTDSAQAKAIVHYAADVRGMKRFAVLYPEVEYGRQMMNLFWDQVDKTGGEMRGAESYPLDTTTFKTYAEKLVGRHDLELRSDWFQGLRELREQHLNQLQMKRALRKLREQLSAVIDFDALFIADSARNVSLVAPALAVENVVTDACDHADIKRIEETTGEKRVKTVELLGWTAWYDPDFDLVQRAGHYVECSVFVDGFFAQSSRPATKAFVEAFQKAYGHEPGLMEAEAYDAGRMVEQVMAGKPPTREAFRDAFAAIKGFDGATGTTTIGPDREPEKELFYLTVTNKGYEELDLSKVQPIAQPGGS
ncbi:MAG TPA: penicillin-binding protein activator [Myxococcales bacterium]|nr:penicillin-binding protein activator [Myxococcales bacterium]